MRIENRKINREMFPPSLPPSNSGNTRGPRDNCVTGSQTNFPFASHSGYLNPANGRAGLCMGAAVTPRQARVCTAHTGAGVPEHGPWPQLALARQPALARL